MEFKYLVLALLLLIVVSLGKALFHLTSAKPEDGDKMVKALAWRIGLSVGLFALLLAAHHYGWIAPQHAVPGYNQ